jgi:hypothetical protein
VTLAERSAASGLSERTIVREQIRWVTESLCEEPGGAKLRAWVEAGRPEANIADLHYVGDRRTGELIVEVLERIPPPVAYDVVRSNLFVSVNGQTGLFSNTILNSRAGRPFLGLIIVLATGRTDDEIQGTVAHEIGHAWRNPSSSSPRCHWAPFQPGQGLFDQTIDVWSELLRDRDAAVKAVWNLAAHEELLASLLVSEWGFQGHAADSRFHMAAARAAVATRQEAHGEEVSTQSEMS